MQLSVSIYIYNKQFQLSELNKTKQKCSDSQIPFSAIEKLDKNGIFFLNGEEKKVRNRNKTSKFYATKMNNN